MTMLAQSRSAPRVPRFLGLLILTLLIASALRLWQIGALPPGLHYDEAADTIIAEQIARGESAPIFVAAYTGKEVLFFYWAALWMKLIGPSAFAMRLAAAMMGILTVAATYRAVYEFLAPCPVPHARQGPGVRGKGDIAVALLATIFIATSFWHVLMSRVGFRSISEPLVQVLALAALFRGVRLNRRRWFIIAGALIGLNLYTYLAARLFPLAIALMFLYIILFDRGHRRERIIQFGLIVTAALIVFAPLGIYFVNQPEAFLTRIQQVAPRADQAGALLDTFGRALGMFFISGDPYIRFNLPGRPLFPIVLGVLFAIGLIVAIIGLFRGRAFQRRLAYFSMLAVTIIMLLPTALAVNEISPSNLRAIGLMPAVFVFPALGVWWLVKRLWTRMTRINTDQHGSPAFIRAIRANPRPILALVLLAGALEASLTYFGQYVREPQLYIQSDGDLADIAQVLNHTHTNQDQVYIAALHYRHPTVAALAERYETYKWLTGDQVIVMPNGPADLFFARLALPDETWLKRFLPDTALVGAPLAPDGRINYRLYHLSSQPIVTPQVKLGMNFGNIVQLMGYDLDEPYVVHVVKAGSRLNDDNRTIRITLYWRILNQPDRSDWSTFAQLRDRWGFEWGQAGSFDYPSEEWSPGEIIVNEIYVPLAAGAPPGEYELRVGWFSQSANQRLNVVAKDGGFGGTVARLSPIDIVQAPVGNAAQLNIGTRIDRELAPGLRLLGDSLESSQVSQNAPIYFTLFWQSTAPLPDTAITLQLTSCGCSGEPKTTIALTTTAPVHNTYPFSQWHANTVIADRYGVRVPPDAPPGQYTLEAAVGQRQPIELGTIEIKKVDRVMTEPPITHRSGNSFDHAIELVGYNMDQTADSITLTLVWHSLESIDHDYTVFTHVIDPSGRTIGGQDNQPVNGTYPTSWWTPGEYVIDRYEIKATGAAIEVGLYDPETGERLGPTVRLK
jgi:hypothetical protein